MAREETTEAGTDANPERSRSLAASTKNSEQRKKMILEQVMILLSGYRREDYNNSELFIRQLCQIFGEYPPSVIMAVTSPMTGIQRSKDFPPVISEIVKALEREMALFQRNAMCERAKRLAREGDSPTQIDRGSRMTMTELRAKYPDLLGVDRSKPEELRQSGFRSLSEIAKEAGVSAEQIAAIPNSVRKG